MKNYFQRFKEWNLEEVYTNSDGITLTDTRQEIISLNSPIDVSDYRYLLCEAVAITLNDDPIEAPYFQAGFTIRDRAVGTRTFFNIRTNLSMREGIFHYHEAIPKIIDVSLFNWLYVAIPPVTYEGGFTDSAKIFPYIYAIDDLPILTLPPETKIILAKSNRSNLGSLASGATYTISNINVEDIKKIQVQLIAETPADASGFKIHLRTHYDKIEDTAYSYNALFDLTPSAINDFYTEILNQTTSTILDYTNIVDVGPMNRVDVVVENLTSGSSNINVAVLGELE